MLLTNSIYRYGGFSGSAPYFDPFNSSYQTNVYTPALPQIGLLTTNRLQVLILDGSHVIDYVQFRRAGQQPEPECGVGGTGIPDVTDDLLSLEHESLTGSNGTPEGIVAQVLVSQGNGTPANSNPNFWQTPPNLPAGLPKNHIRRPIFFNAFFNELTGSYGLYNYNGRHTNTLLQCRRPTRRPAGGLYYETWQVNDPLVHYLASDLNYTNPMARLASSALIIRTPPFRRSTSASMGHQALVAMGGQLQHLHHRAQQLCECAVADGAERPAHLAAGQLGFSERKVSVRRLARARPSRHAVADGLSKASDILTNGNNVGVNSWAEWTGDMQNNFDATNSAPLQDAGLFDLFTVAPNLNATHGTLSVNQTNLAAWSAVFSGLVAMTNASADFKGYVAAPAVASAVIPPAWRGQRQFRRRAAAEWHTGINATRAATINADGVPGAFKHVGDIVRTPALTEQSPFLAGLSTRQRRPQR